MDMKKNSEENSKIEEEIKSRHKVKDKTEAMERAKLYKLQKNEKNKKQRNGNYKRE